MCLKILGFCFWKTFDDFKADEVREKLINTDVNLLTPVEALNLLVELKKLAD